jgi:DNA gyrase subunit A
MVVTVTLDGYIKRTPLSTFRAQARGGKGRSGMATKDEDAVGTMFVASTHTPVLFFSTAGKVYRLKVWRLPEGARPPRPSGRQPAARARPGRNHRRRAAAARRRGRMGQAQRHVRHGQGQRAPQRDGQLCQHPSNGKFAMKFDDETEDRLIGVALLSEGDDVLLASRAGKAIRFPADDVREFQSRTSTGVRGMALKDGDEVISLSILHRAGVKDQDEREDYLRFAPWKAERKANRR